MDVGRAISGSQLLHKTEHTELTSAAVNRSEQQITTNPNDASEKNETRREPELINRVELEAMVDGFNDFLEPIHTSIKFEMHDKLEKYYVTVVDTTTKEIIREIPPRKMLDMYASMAEFMGLIVDKKI